jgi:dipeptidyl aminopeptidase/acylaminoacyl peptidase
VRWSWTIVAAALALATQAIAAPPDGPLRTFTGSDLFSLQYAADPQIRPDGRAIAYTRVANNIMTDRAQQSIWSIDTETGVQSPIVTAPGSHHTPRWSPDGTRLAYVSTSDQGAPQLYVRWLDGNRAAKLAELTRAPDSLAWSHDGRRLAITMFAPDEPAKLGQAPAKPEGAQWGDPLQVIADITYRADGEGYLEAGYTHVYVISADGGAPQQITFGAFNERGPVSWSADDQFIYVTGNRDPDWRREPVNTEIYRVAVATGEITALTHRKGPDDAPAVSPDGKQIAYLGFDDELLGYANVMLYVMDRDGSNVRCLTSRLDRSIEEVQWAADGHSLYVLYDDRAITKVARVSLDGRVEPVAQGLAGGSLDRPYTGGRFTVARDGSVAFTSGTTSRPADVSVTRGGRARQLTQLNEGALANKTLAEVVALPVVSSLDQRAIDAWLVLPPNFDHTRRYPLILEIHGGPFAAYGPLFSTDDQLYAAAGYVVLYANPRGSTSYGAEFANLIHHDYPNHDYDDLISAVDAAIARGSVDPDNLFVTGGSGGGVLTAWIVGKTNRFKAAAAQKPVINWASTALTTDGYTYMSRYWFGTMAWEDPTSYWKRSPLSLVGSVTTPTLVVVGEKDYRTPVSESEQYYQALQLRGIPTALVKVPGASHEGIAARPSQSAAKASAILAWFERYRGK